ncbi:hypothetical protein U2F26_16790 [Micromonospora sp. 4G57]|uniref:Uncharacterized protein n=1 Tax=Micromonospora sicca TaxID=2202420 RepID=A0ABU5JB14_9ACTN|nr:MULTISPECIES: hypothetical protein [unclassified Micromonospora]MDZ5444379.1 hypothetical protein [Micromonospora sp. 4G57]MDZ5489787.1 hypothetical protein [Micromonospora sp. 4G53]
MDAYLLGSMSHRRQTHIEQSEGAGHQADGGNDCAKRSNQLQQIVRRGSTSSVRYRRAMMLLASAGGNRVPVIAQLVQADGDTYASRPALRPMAYMWSTPVGPRRGISMTARPWSRLCRLAGLDFPGP